MAIVCLGVRVLCIDAVLRDFSLGHKTPYFCFYVSTRPFFFHRCTV